ncbi:hypothetical protein [Deinococcus arenicola]|uniref:Glycine zipper family protein n=1 Tax=Deinococcus arenicola TaxID=2994950 RepID=A0ABU4DNB9_9DEIO|nr:hypothetical protein [Deinococcus sp. ZS9-10]MDV6373589.1 hypothetical protein [Deinococcus sp. ZS9-10]
MKFQNRGQAWASGMVFGIGLSMLLGAATDLGLAVGAGIGVALAAWWSRGLPDK